MLTRTTREEARQLWATPPELVRALERRWVPGGFTIDVASVESTAVCRRWLGPGSPHGEDGLAQSWSGEHVWCNPPYGDVHTWVDKALGREAIVSVLLLPVRASASWWLPAIRGASAIDWIRGRVNFTPPPGVQSSSNAEATVALIYRRDLMVSTRKGRLVVGYAQ